MLGEADLMEIDVPLEVALTPVVCRLVSAVIAAARLAAIRSLSTKKGKGQNS
jgi:hypothetical protein